MKIVIKFSVSHSEGEIEVESRDIPSNWDELTKEERKAALNNLVDEYENCIYDYMCLSQWAEVIEDED